MTLTRRSNPSFQPVRDGILSALIIFSIAIATGGAVYYTAAGALKKEVQASLMSLAGTAANLVDGDLHKEITQADQKYSPVYEQVRKPFYSLLKSNPNIAFIYTVIPKDEKIYFILDSKIIAEGDKDDTSDVMEEYTDATDMMKLALQTKTAMVEDEAYTDEWGTFLSGYAPIYDSAHNFVGIAGADIRITDYLDRLARVKQALFIGIAIALIASIIAGYSVYASRKSSLLAEQKSREQQDAMKALEDKQIAEREAQKRQSEEDNRIAMHQMADSFEQSVRGVVENLSTSAQQITFDSKKVKNISGETLQASTMVSLSSEKATQTSSQVSAAAEELSASIQEISSQTQKSSIIATEATQKAETARTVILTMAEKSAKVNDILGMITGVANQINLLSLNATIEAARAGEAGKGFAVVAGEVKNLSNQVSIATNEISTQINEMQSATDLSVKSVMEILQIIEEMTHSTQSVAAAVEEQAVVTNEIANNIVRTADDMRNISENITDVESGAQQTSSFAEEMLHATDVLGQQSELLRQKVDEFVKRVRS